MNSSITSLIQLKALLISLNGVFEMTVILPKSSRCVVGSFHALVAPELTSVYIDVQPPVVEEWSRIKVTIRIIRPFMEGDVEVPG